MSAWTDHVDRWKDCQKCPLCKQRDRICLARGTVPCEVLFIGEAPGASEDALGQPFVGPAGKLLDAIILSALPVQHIEPVTFALTNLVACFPREAKERGENEPEHSEILACRPRLVEFVNVARPRLIVCVGSLAANYVDHADTVPCCDIVHPAATFPPRMTRARAQQEIHHATVVLRCAVQTMIESRGNWEYKEWGKRHAGKSKREQIRSAYEDAVTDSDIPF